MQTPKFNHMIWLGFGVTCKTCNFMELEKKSTENTELYLVDHTVTLPSCERITGNLVEIAAKNNEVHFPEVRYMYISPSKRCINVF